MDFINLLYIENTDFLFDFQLNASMKSDFAVPEWKVKVDTTVTDTSDTRNKRSMRRKISLRRAIFKPFDALPPVWTLFQILSSYWSILYWISWNILFFQNVWRYCNYESHLEFYKHVSLGCPSLLKIDLFSKGTHWKEAMKILKLVVTRSSSLSVPPVGVSMQSSFTDSLTLPPFVDTDSHSKKELPGELHTCNYDFSCLNIIDYQKC